MINATKEGHVEKGIQLKKRTILKIVGRSDFYQNRELGNNQSTETQLPTNTSISTVSSFEN
ncbi:MAG: hypothetical protein JWR38_565 [Mucilaginibacter sp.]|nr:hypothetical protein [Mucilaginibacter sp.]